MGRPNTGPRLRLEPNGVYAIAWSENRRTKRVSTGTRNLQEAQKVLGGFLLEQEQERERGHVWTVGQIIQFYDDNHVAKKVRNKNTQRRMLAMAKKWLGEDTPIDQISADDMTRYYDGRRKVPGYKGDQIKDATIRREWNAFLAAVNYAVRNRKVENRHAPMIDLPPHSPGRDRWLTEEEAARLLAAAQPEGEKRLTRVHRLIALALGTARRREAIESLTWFKVDLKNRTIDFRRPDEPETTKRRGIAAISDWLLPILERAYREKTSEYVLDRPTPLLKPLQAAVKAAGLEDVTAHTLRHTWGTWAAQKGASMWEIAGGMGCTVATAERTYLHHSPDHLRGVMNRVSVAPAGAQPRAQSEG